MMKVMMTMVGLALVMSLGLNLLQITYYKVTVDENEALVDIIIKQRSLLNSKEEMICKCIELSEKLRPVLNESINQESR